jgi:hypothetical protein
MAKKKRARKKTAGVEIFAERLLQPGEIECLEVVKTLWRYNDGRHQQAFRCFDCRELRLLVNLWFNETPEGHDMTLGSVRELLEIMLDSFDAVVSDHGENARLEDLLWDEG